MTPSGIEPATFRLVMQYQCLSQQLRIQIITPASLPLREKTELAKIYILDLKSKSTCWKRPSVSLTVIHLVHISITLLTFYFWRYNFVNFSVSWTSHRVYVTDSYAKCNSGSYMNIKTIRFHILCRKFVRYKISSYFPRLVR